MGKPGSGILLALAIITGEENQEVKSHAGAGAVRRAAAGAAGGRYQRVLCTRTGRSRAATAGH